VSAKVLAAIAKREAKKRPKPKAKAEKATPEKAAGE
jgi:hypothetical protein